LESGPRFVLNPIKILSGSFDGAVLYENPNFVSPNMIRELMRRKEQHSYTNRKEIEEEREQRNLDIKSQLPKDQLEGVFTSGDVED